MQAAHEFHTNPRDLVVVERLQTIGREWASKVHVLSGAVDEIVQPWSAAASKLALAATSGDAEELKKQVSFVFQSFTKFEHAQNEGLFWMSLSFFFVRLRSIPSRYWNELDKKKLYSETPP